MLTIYWNILLMGNPIKGLDCVSQCNLSEKLLLEVLQVFFLRYGSIRAYVIKKLGRIIASCVTEAQLSYFN